MHVCARVFSKEHLDKEDYWHGELRSLGIEPKRKDLANDKEELASLTDNLKQTMYQDYKTAYSKDNEEDESKFDYII
jgi:hypothetical protein